MLRGERGVEVEAGVWHHLVKTESESHSETGAGAGAYTRAPEGGRGPQRGAIHCARFSEDLGQRMASPHCPEDIQAMSMIPLPITHGIGDLNK